MKPLITILVLAMTLVAPHHNTLLAVYDLAAREKMKTAAAAEAYAEQILRGV